MTTQAKDLQYYIDHPDEAPDDHEELMRLYAEANAADAPADDTEGEQDVSATAAESASSGETDKKAEETTESKGDTKAAAAEAGDTEAPIATRDGKGTIPFNVLKTEREKRQAAEERVAEMQRRLEAVEAQLAKGTQRGDAKAAEIAQEASDAIPEEEMTALREDFPAFAKLLDAANSRISKLMDTVSTLTQREQSRDASEQAKAAKTTQEMIDDEPVLLHLQTNDPDLWARAVELDNMLAKTGKYTSLADRFAKVAEQMESLFGPFEGVAKKAAPVAQPQPAAKKDPADVKKALAEKLPKAGKPNSLSDLPSGEAPETDERSAVETMSAAEIGQMFLKMSPEKQREYLNRL